MTQSLLRACLPMLCLCLATLPACESMREAPPMSREEYVQDLMQSAGVSTAISRAQSESLADGHSNIERVRSEFGERMNNLPAEQRERVEAATDRYVMASRKSFDVAAAASAWARTFTADLSDADLKKIDEFAHTPAGGRAMANGLNAALSLQEYLQQRRSQAADKALQQYENELRAIVGAPH